MPKKITSTEGGQEAAKRGATMPALPGRQKENLRPDDAGSEEMVDSSEQRPPEPTRPRHPR